MRRSDIKADGTIYADDVLNAIRVVDVERLWESGGSRYGKRSYTRPATSGTMSNTSRPTGFYVSYQGFLVVMTGRQHVGVLSTLSIPTNLHSEGALLEWKSTLPDEVIATVLVSRDFAGTFENVKAKENQKFDALRQQREHAEASERECSRLFQEAETALDRHGVTCHRYYPPGYANARERSTAYAVVRASDLTALLDRLHALENSTEDA